ncbi:MAG: glutamine--fructose-6-phosphate transaminase (isomerizing) [Elusimicrobia bacterium]|nr:glutamine--fructose-6-phosphate transaminase (isomerizing) [Elusimicrobiota bacterium]MDE2425088.1 glutamine--fructose-6-phosphate transaminase (isomerizing) [Elusimicrobiota bacterium]
MCGIVGYAGRRQASPLLMEGLKRLEYRGYDSAGVAVLCDGKIARRRASGKLANLEALIQKEPLKGLVALGHTRWATHGKPSEENAHPHADCGGELVVIHNGIIENYLELKEALSAGRHVFQSETDTEIVAHLIEEKLKGLAGAGRSPTPDLNEPLLFEAVRQALGQVRGAYALAVLWAKAPGVIVSAKTASPLIIGLGEGENFLASDVPAFLAHTRKAVFLEDGEMAVLKAGGCTYFNLSGKRIEKKPVQIQWDRTMAEKSGYRHFMLKEIHEQPAACEDTMRGRFFPLKDGVLKRECGLETGFLKEIRQIRLLGCGTAYHAGLVAKYWLEALARLPVHCETASEFRYRETTVGPGELVIAVSQSGETADTLAAVKLAKEKGAKALAVCNTVGSAIARAADFNLFTHCGPEFGVASTKAFIGQLTALAVFCLHCGAARGALGEPEARRLVDQLLCLPGDIRSALKLEPQIKELARRFYKKEHFLFIGRHVNYAIALEGALKLKEISYIHAEGYAAGELKHGPIALIDDSMPVVAIGTRSRVHEKMLSSLEEVKARGAELICLGTEGDARPRGADSLIVLPQTPELLSPIVNIVPLQLLAYHIADLRGCDVDQPRNLAKSVTVE